MSTLPDWIPVDAWEGFVAMRKKMRKPLTDRAIQLAVGNLDKLREQGQDVGAVLDQSTMNSWLGLFPVAERRNEASTDQRRSLPSLGKHGQATANNMHDWLEGFV